MPSNKPRLTIEYQHIMQEASLTELEVLKNIRMQKNYDFLKPFLARIIATEKEKIFKLPESDPQYLAIEKAFSRGLVAGLINFSYIVDAADAELTRRLEESKK